MTGIGHDLRYAFRSLRRSPGYTFLCVAALALGIGANGAIFSLVEAIMLRPLPYPQPERLVMPHMTVTTAQPDPGIPPRMQWSHPKLQAMIQAQQVFTDVAGFASESTNLTGGEEPERLQLELVSPSYFRVLGVQPIRGRAFVADDGKPEAPVVALLGEGLWRRRFGSDERVLGRTVHLDRKPVTVVGIVPDGFSGLTGEAELWVPVSAVNTLWYPEALAETHNHFLEAVARLRPGVTAERAQAEMARVGKLVAAALPIPDEAPGTVWGAGVVGLAEAREDAFVRRALLVLLAAVAAVLLIACANLASLALVRSLRRRREVAVRRAIGASVGRLVRQSLAESLLLALIGGAAGLAVAGALVRVLVSLRPEALGTWGVASSELQSFAAAELGPQVVLYCALAALLSALLFGLAPALRAARAEPDADLRQGGGNLGGGFGLRGRAGSGGRRLLVAGQLALAVVTLSGAGLLLRSLWQLQSLDLGFAPERVLAFSVRPPSGQYAEDAVGPFHDRLLERLRGISGAEQVSLGDCLPVSNACSSSILFSLDGQPVSRASAPELGWQKVSGGYFRTLGVPLLAGRTFDQRDRNDAPRVAILNATAARLLFPGQEAVGHRFQMGTLGLNGEVHAEVVGVVGDVRYRGLENAMFPEVFLPDSQVTLGRTTVYVKSRGTDPLQLLPEIRAAVAAVDPDLPIYRSRTMEEQLGFAFSKSRFSSLLLAAFAGVALLLAALGVYGVLSQAVAARRREIGLRMALGAPAGQVERLVLRQGMTVAVAGCLTGLAFALVLLGPLRGLLYRVEPRDPLTLGAVATLLLVVALLACLAPARRASRIDPIAALRQD